MTISRCRYACYDAVESMRKVGVCIPAASAYFRDLVCFLSHHHSVSSIITACYLTPVMRYG